jgi:acyl-CoA synthetase
MELQVFDDARIVEYTAAGFWDDESIAQRIRTHAQTQPDGLAFLGDGDFRLTWSEYDDLSSRLGAAFVALGLERGDPVGLFLPDSPTAHVAYVAAEKAGLVAVGLGPRSGVREAAHLLTETASTVLVTAPTQRGQDTAAFVTAVRELGAPVGRHVVVDHRPGRFELSVDGAAVAVSARDAAEDALDGRALGPNDLFFINSTSGTTGLPKCVMHTQNRWKYFHKKCKQFTTDERFMVVVPNPFGFGLWMGHFSPTMLGCPTVLTEDFDPETTLATIERERITVLAAVTTQVLMLLASPKLDSYDITSLRIVQSGGERVPFEPAREFEDRTGSKILQFYGSNEAGCLCGTTMEDTTEKRLGTAGRIFPEMQVRVFDEHGTDVTATGGPGRSACKGPGITPGYFGNPQANAELFRDDGWMYLGDIIEIDSDGYLRVVGRTADFIIRGGHNVSAPAVEEELLTHPRVAMAAVVGMPDPLLGERVCAYVVTADGGDMTVDELAVYLGGRGVSKTMWPERVVCVRELPNAGGKVAKSALRADIARRLDEARVAGR